MAAVRGRDTRPERQVRSLVHRMGFRFRLHVRDLPGRPDIVFPRFHKVVFVHGCFWHRHPSCVRATTPQTNRDFWNAKFARNVERDANNVRSLASQGWKSLTVWECELREPAKVADRISRFLARRVQ
jgi:DNA mismatch endonuclease (patch repair protein)